MCRTGARSAILGLAALVVALMVGAAGLRAAQDVSPVATSDHPMVGTWYIGLQGDPPGRGPTLATYFADGNVLVSAAAGPRPVTWQGVWVPTGPRTATFTIVAVNVDQNGTFTGNTILDGTNELDATGDQFTTTGTITMRDLAGQVLSSFPVAAIGSRVAASTPATATGGTPIATPAN